MDGQCQDLHQDMKRRAGDHVVRGDGPMAVSSKLGYFLSSPLPVPQPHSVVTSLLNIAVNHDAEEQDLQKF